MKLLFRQRFFSWFDSYDIYDEQGRTVFTVEGKMSWGHKLHILDSEGVHIGTVKQEVFTFLPKFELYIGEEYIGRIVKALTFFVPSYQLECNGWSVSGDFMEWEYTIEGTAGDTVAVVSKELFQFTDTYTIDVADPNDALLALMVVLAIDAEKCARN